MKGGNLMKKFIIIFSIFLFVSFSINTANAATEPKTLTQGMYNISDEKLLTGINYNVRNTSTSKSLLLVIDSSENIQQLIRLEPNSPKYTLKPLNFGDLIVIIGAATLEFY